MSSEKVRKVASELEEKYYWFSFKKEPKRSFQTESEESLKKWRHCLRKKKAYATEAEAIKAVIKNGLNYYKCEYCGFYHLTSISASKRRRKN